jgi:hypothetical protein
MKDLKKKKKQNEVTFWWDGNMADGPWSIALTFDMFKYLYIRVQYLEDHMGMKDHAFA